MGKIGGGLLSTREYIPHPPSSLHAGRFQSLTLDLPFSYEKKIKDYNFGSLIRTDARQEYAEANTIFGTRHFPL